MFIVQGLVEAMARSQGALARYKSIRTSMKSSTARSGGPFEAQAGQGRRTPKRVLEFPKRKIQIFWEFVTSRRISELK